MATKIGLYILICFSIMVLDRPVHVAGEAPLIFAEHIDFVYLRLRYLLDKTPTDIDPLRHLLHQELNSTTSYREAWEEGTQIFNDRKATLVVPDERIFPEEYHIALITYTIHDTPKDNPFFSVFNIATRTLCSELSVDDYKFKSFFQLLRLATETLGKTPRFAPTSDQLYRGITIRYDFPVGRQVVFQQYSSLSANRSVSEAYSGNVTLLTFQKMKGIGISLEFHSKFPGESEILVSPLQVFKVTNVDLGNGKMYDTFTLIPIDDGSGFKYFRSAGSKVMGGLVLYLMSLYAIVII